MSEFNPNEEGESNKEYLSRLTVRDFKELLDRLNPELALILYYRLTNETNAQIAKKYKKSVPWMEGKMREIYGKFEIDTTEDSSSVLEGYLNEYFRTPFMEMIDEDPKNIHLTFFKESPEKSPKPKRRTRAVKAVKAESKAVKAQLPLWARIALTAVLVLLVGFVAFRVVQNSQTPPTLTSTSTPTTLSTNEVVPPVVPTDTATSQPTETPTVVASETSLPTPTITAVPPTPTFTPTGTSFLTITPTQPSTESTIIATGPSGDWSVRIYQTDDANIILVNNHIVGATLYRQTLDWVEINSLLQKGVSNYVTAVNLNGFGGGVVWGFSLRRNEVIVWGNEGNADRCLFCYTQTVEILPDDKVAEVNLREFDKKNLSGSWTAKVKAADFGVIMVNGVAVAGSHKGLDLGWSDITGLLYEGQGNIITAAIWNKDGDYSWDLALRRGETVVWGSNDQGSGQVGEVFFTTVIVDGAGNIIP